MSAAASPGCGGTRLVDQRVVEVEREQNPRRVLGAQQRVGRHGGASGGAPMCRTVQVRVAHRTRPPRRRQRAPAAEGMPGEVEVLVEGFAPDAAAAGEVER